MGKVYVIIYWIIERVQYFFLFLMVLFIGIVIQLWLVANFTLPISLLESLNVLMGDSPSLVAIGKFPTLFHKIVFVELIVLRFSGWLILPLVIGLVFAASENSINEKRRIAFEDQLNQLEGAEKGDSVLFQTLVDSGLSPEEAQAVVKQDREETFRLLRESI